MKKIIILLMCLLLAASFAACGKKDTQSASSGSDAGSAIAAGTEGSDMFSADAPAQMANPFKDCASLDEAEQVAGFEITTPEEVSGLGNTVVQAVDDDMIQVYYCQNPENVQEGDYALFRKAAGNEDISGDYSQYAYEKEVDVDGLTVTFKGYEGNNLAVWSDGEYSYSIYSTEELSDEAMANLVRTLQ